MNVLTEILHTISETIDKTRWVLRWDLRERRLKILNRNFAILILQAYVNLSFRRILTRQVYVDDFVKGSEWITIL